MSKIIKNKPEKVLFFLGCINSLSYLKGIINKKRSGNYNPILLNPETLKKAGFQVRIPNSGFINSWMHHSSNLILNSYKEILKTYFLYPALWNPCKKLKWLHQLQNLYFALTGEELDIKL